MDRRAQYQRRLGRVFRSCFSALLASLLLAAVGCGTPEDPKINSAIEFDVNLGYGFIDIPVGAFRVDGNVLDTLRKAESTGLITLRQIPQDYWSSFLNTTQGMGQPYEVTATPKLLGIAGDWTRPVERGSPLRVRLENAKVDKIVKNEEYKGPLATPGEQHRLVLGLYKRIPTEAARAMGTEWSPLEERPMRFRCVVRFSEFKKDWRVVQLDIGEPSLEQWQSQNVK